VSAYVMHRKKCRIHSVVAQFHPTSFRKIIKAFVFFPIPKMKSTCLPKLLLIIALFLCLTSVVHVGAEVKHDHDHDGHDHAAHNHTGHDHDHNHGNGTESHEHDHDHEGHDHSGHDHSHGPKSAKKGAKKNSGRKMAWSMWCLLCAGALGISI
jgi:ABC-type nickel/cobalt efflux system permease component RcnA